MVVVAAFRTVVEDVAEYRFWHGRHVSWMWRKTEIFGDVRIKTETAVRIGPRDSYRGTASLDDLRPHLNPTDLSSRVPDFVKKGQKMKQ